MVVRIGKDGELRNSRPCNHCLDTMIKYKIKKIIYSTEDGNIISEKPKDMEKNHISSGWKSFNKLINN
jgi:pyrimidine deaminase RibD-like protein